MTEREHIPIQVHEYMGDDTVLYQGHSEAAPQIEFEPPITSQVPCVEPMVGNLPPPPGAQDAMVIPQTPQIVQPPPITLFSERLDILDQIDDYRFSRFTERINKEYPGIFDDLRNASDEDLSQRLEVMKVFIAKKSLSKQAELLFRGGLRIADSAFTTIGWNVDGASDLISEDEDILDMVEEVRLKYRTKNKIEPEYKLAVGVFSIYSKINANNKQRGAVEEALKLREARQKIDSHLNTADKTLEDKYKEI